ncbi:hypothetical protein BJ085DRAFT_38086 [Dimargaris cristalligena]|uniref:Actin cytoskeleton-regulatory complex protein SLA1 n=1 Tax=Dimargaris cristalligena TaxID=215637 RepID=A0A4P9ZYW4_9FUNG|nr:hypothetical protein BJ085DRAFT_38086 [Dimargaris cristalligena]|eukprot:RKP38944.1 hypothetical protein BJ085DRAFT_38086 [Dimargaris cristalligena]
MPFVDICVALYKYEAQDAEELNIDEGDVLYLLDTSDPDWHLVKPKPSADSAQSPPNPEQKGLVPATYIERVQPLNAAKALYDYAATGEEELTIQEDDRLEVLSDDDPDWTIVRKNGQAGFVPSSYIELEHLSPTQPTPATAPVNPVVVAAAESAPPPAPAPQLAPAAPRISEDTEPHPPAQSPTPSSPKADPKDIAYWSVTECAKKKKDNRKGLLGVGDLKIFYSCTSDKSPVLKWHIDVLKTFTVKKDTITLEFNDPTTPELRFQLANKADAKAVGAKIEVTRHKLLYPESPPMSPTVPRVSTDSMNGLSRTSIDHAFGTSSPAATPGMVEAQLATVLYDFESEESEELSVSAGQLVYVLDCTSNPDWWACQVVVEDGSTPAEGLVPASYVQLAEPAEASASTKSKAITSPTKAAITAKPTEIAESPNGRASEDNLPLQELMNKKASQESTTRRRSRTNSSGHGPVDGYPDPKNVRTWVDRTNTFRVKAEFIGLTEDGRVKLHKENGVKIAVPLGKFDTDSLAYVKQHEGGARTSVSARELHGSTKERPFSRVVSTPPKSKKINLDFDWFDFFTLKCDVKADEALLYATSFTAERLDDSDLKGIKMSTLETLGVHPPDRQRILDGIQRFLGKKSGAGKQVSFGATSFIDETKAAGPVGDSDIARQMQLIEVDQTKAAAAPKAESSNKARGLSSIDERFERQRQIEEDELLARKLQDVEKNRRKPSGKSPVVLEDPFTSGNTPSPLVPTSPVSSLASSSYAQPLGLGLGGRKTTSKRAPPAKSAPSSIDPRQILQAQKQLSETSSPRSPISAIVSPPPPQSALKSRSAAPTSPLGFDDDQWIIHDAPVPDVNKQLPQLPAPSPPTQANTLAVVVRSEANNPPASQPPAMIPLASALQAPLVPTPNVYMPGSGVFVPTRQHRAPPPPPANQPPVNLAAQAASLFQGARPPAQLNPTFMQGHHTGMLSAQPPPLVPMVSQPAMMGSLRPTMAGPTFATHPSHSTNQLLAHNPTQLTRSLSATPGPVVGPGAMVLAQQRPIPVGNANPHSGMVLYGSNLGATTPPVVET